MLRNDTYLKTALPGVLVGALCWLAPGAAASAASSDWKPLEGAHVKRSRAKLVRQMKKDGVKTPAALLKHPYLVRVQLEGAGGGSAKHSEVVIRFRSKPQRVVAKAWNRGGPQPGRAQLGAWGSCKLRKGAVGRSCPRKYNGKGFVDVTDAFTQRNILFVHDPRYKGRGHSVIWFAADRSQKHLWYYVVPKKGWPSFGRVRVSVRKFQVPADEPPARLPGSPPDPGARPRPTPRPDPGATPRPPPGPDPRATPRPSPRPDPRATPRPAPRAGPRVSRPRPAAWKTVSADHRPAAKATLRRRMRRDGIRHPDHLLGHRYVVRLRLEDAGGGSRSRSELQLRLLSQPDRALGKAWADRKEMRRAQLGAEDRCRPLPAASGGPEGKRCPVHFNNLGWRNLISAFSSVRMRLVSDPNDNGQGHMLLWLAFDHAQSGLAYRFVRRPSLPSFGKGKVRIDLYEVRDGGATPDPGARPRPTPRPQPDPGTQPDPGLPTDPDARPRKGPGAGWTALSGGHRGTSRAALVRRMRRDGVSYPQHLLQHKYLVRLSIYGAGGPQQRRSEIVLRLSSRPKAALGTGMADHRRRWGAQAGPLDRCKRMPRPRNPYGRGRGWQSQPAGHVCPLQYGGLGWRNLIGAFTGKKVMFITAPWRPGRGKQLLWLGFDQPQDAMAFRPAQGPSGKPGKAYAKVRADKLVVGRGGGAPGARPDPPGTWKPVPPGSGAARRPAGAGWTPLRGRHLKVPKNTLYYTIERDGFKNPGYLLAKRYLVRVKVTGATRRAETLLRFAAAPARGVGKARASSRSGVQLGTPQACRRRGGPQAFCPLHFANIGWRNLKSGLQKPTVLVVTDPGGPGKTATTTLWLAFDRPQGQIFQKRVRRAAGKANVSIKRYRW